MKEAKFKVGDKVIGNEKANRYGVTKQGWKGTVVEVCDDGDIRCSCRTISSSEIFRVHIFRVHPECFDLDTSDDIKVGDNEQEGEKEVKQTDLKYHCGEIPTWAICGCDKSPYKEDCFFFRSEPDMGGHIDICLKDNFRGDCCDKDCAYYVSHATASKVVNDYLKIKMPQKIDKAHLSTTLKKLEALQKVISSELEMLEIWEKKDDNEKA